MNEYPFHDVPFQPMKGLFSPHLQTIFGSFGPAGNPPPSAEVRIDLWDGDQLSCLVSTPPAYEKTILLIHGLAGSSESNYMIRMARKLYRAGFRVVRINLRGSGKGKGLSKLPYHAGRSEDLTPVIEKFCETPITLLGFSLGGNMVLKYGGEKPNAPLLERIIAVCAPLDLSSSAALLTKHKLYNSYFLKKLRPYASRWIGNQKVSSIYDFDNGLTAPLGGFKDADDYYAKCSSRHFVPQISHPCDLLFALDDPLIDTTSLSEITLPATTQIWLSKHGGHMGFLGKSDGPHINWMDHFLLQLLTTPKAVE